MPGIFIDSLFILILSKTCQIRNRVAMVIAPLVWQWPLPHGLWIDEIFITYSRNYPGYCSTEIYLINFRISYCNVISAFLMDKHYFPLYCGHAAVIYTNFVDKHWIPLFSWTHYNDFHYFLEKTCYHIAVQWTSTFFVEFKKVFQEEEEEQQQQQIP